MFLCEALCRLFGVRRPKGNGVGAGRDDGLGGDARGLQVINKDCGVLTAPSHDPSDVQCGKQVACCRTDRGRLPGRGRPLRLPSSGCRVVRRASAW